MFKDLTKDAIIQMKNDLLKWVIHQLEKLECNIFEKEIEK